MQCKRPLRKALETKGIRRNIDRIGLCVVFVGSGSPTHNASGRCLLTVGMLASTADTTDPPGDPSRRSKAFLGPPGHARWLF